MQLFAQLSVAHRLALGFSISLALAAGSAALAIGALASVAEDTRTMMAEPLAKERLIQEWARNIHSGVRRTTAIAASTESGMGAVFAEDQRASTEHSAELQRKLEAALDSPQERKLYAAIQERRTTYLAARDAILAARRAGQAEEAAQLFKSRFTPALGPYLESVDALLRHQQSEISDTATDIDVSYHTYRRCLIAVALLNLALSACVAWWITRSITRPLSAGVKAAGAIAQGDLSQRIEVQGGGETAALQAALATMNQALERQVHGIRDHAQLMLGVAGEIATGNADLAERTEQAAANLQETAAALEELAATVKHTAAASLEARKLANTARLTATSGSDSVSQVSVAMAEIAEASRRIGEITGTIDSLAFQTNILALNAAVEAARAGDQGRGFAVVASEVRALAQRSTRAAREIKTLIDDSSARVATGNSRAQEAAVTMGEVRIQAERVAELIAGLSHAAEEQASGIAQVNVAVSQLDQMTQQNAALVEQSSAAAESLKQQARGLAQEVAGFRLSESASA